MYIIINWPYIHTHTRRNYTHSNNKGCHHLKLLNTPILTGNTSTKSCVTYRCTCHTDNYLPDSYNNVPESASSDPHALSWPCPQTVVGISRQKPSLATRIFPYGWLERDALVESFVPREPTHQKPLYLFHVFMTFAVEININSDLQKNDNTHS